MQIKFNSFRLIKNFTALQLFFFTAESHHTSEEHNMSKGSGNCALSKAQNKTHQLLCDRALCRLRHCGFIAHLWINNPACTYSAV